MSKYPIREEDNHFYEDDYHDMHADDLDRKVYVVFGVIGLVILYQVIKFIMLYG